MGLAERLIELIPTAVSPRDATGAYVEVPYGVHRKRLYHGTQASISRFSFLCWVKLTFKICSLVYGEGVLKPEGGVVGSRDDILVWRKRPEVLREEGRYFGYARLSVVHGASAVYDCGKVDLIG